MVQDEAIVVFSFSNEFTYLDQNGQKGTASLSYYPEDPFLKDTSVELVSGLTTGESGNYGKTLFPDFDGEQNSTTNHIEIYLHSSLSTVGAAEAFSHEGYGHVLLYILSGYDHETASHQPRGMEDHNLRLVEMILSARRETINNINQ